MPRSANEIAEMIDALKLFYVAAASSVFFIIREDQDLGAIVPGFTDSGTNIILRRVNGPYYEAANLNQALEFFRSNSRHNLDYMAFLLTTVVSIIGHALDGNSYFDKSPELEALRHVRNGLSHGNRFHFRKDEPRRPAHFGRFVIDQSLQDQPILFNYMDGGDLFDLFDAVRDHLLIPVNSP